MRTVTRIMLVLQVMLLARARSVARREEDGREEGGEGRAEVRMKEKLDGGGFVHMRGSEGGKGK